MAQAVDELVGRAAELGVVDDALERLERNRSGALALVGEPGIGKTRMLAELEARAAAKGRSCSRGMPPSSRASCRSRSSSTRSTSTSRRSSRRSLDSLDHADACRARPHPAVALPRTADRAGRSSDDRYRAHSAVCRLLEALAASKPLVLVLDDLHWADSGSIELLGALLRRPPSEAVLLALAVRPAPAPGAPIGRARTRPSRRRLTRLELEPCRGGGPRELLGADIDLPRRPRSTRRPAATPSISSSSPGAPRRAGDRRRPPAGSRSPGSRCRGPWPPRWPRSSRCSRITTRRVLEGAAVAGDPFEPELAAAAAGSPRGGRRWTRSTSSSSATLSATTDVPRRFRFRHPLVRRAVYEAAPGGWRLGAHERTAEALAARGAPAVERAPSRRVLRPPRRPRRRRGVARSGRGGCGANAGDGGAPVRGRAAATARDRAC